MKGWKATWAATSLTLVLFAIAACNSATTSASRSNEPALTNAAHSNMVADGSLVGRCGNVALGNGAGLSPELAGWIGVHEGSLGPYAINVIITDVTQDGRAPGAKYVYSGNSDSNCLPITDAEINGSRFGGTLPNGAIIALERVDANATNASYYHRGRTTSGSFTQVDRVIPAGATAASVK